MFPCNGSLIKTERYSLKTTLNTFVSTSVLKDGHTFSIHLVDPITETKITPESSYLSNTEMKIDSDRKSCKNKKLKYFLSNRA